MSPARTQSPQPAVQTVIPQLEWRPSAAGLSPDFEVGTAGLQSAVPHPSEIFARL